MAKYLNLSLGMLMMMLLTFATSCGNEPNDSTDSKIVGTWFYEEEFEEYGESYFDSYTLVFSKDQTGYIRNEYGTRGVSSLQMNFDWSLTTTSNGQYLLSIIYKSGDRDIDGPFEGGYAQYNRNVTIAGKTLSISTGDNTVMLFTKK